MENVYAAPDCDPNIELCYDILFVPYPVSIKSTVWLGMIALIRSVLPVILYNVAEAKDSSSSIYTNAWKFWLATNSLIFGFLTLLWPMTYFEILIDFYLAYWSMAGISVSIGLTILSALLFVYGSTKDSDGWMYLGIYLGVEPIALFLSNIYYKRAFDYYTKRGLIEMIVIIYEATEPKPELETIP